MKKLSVVAVAVCLLVGSSFAAWDYFPPKDAGKGQARLNFEYGIPAEKVSTMDLAIKARYSFIQGLEAALALPIPLSYTVGDFSAKDYVGLSQPAIGVRYWLPMGLGFYVDCALPVDTREGKDPPTELGLGAQFSTNFTDDLSLGSQLGVSSSDFGHLDKNISLIIGAELDYAISAATIFLGAEGDLDLHADNHPFGVDLWIGAAYSITEMIGVDLSATFGLGESKGGKDNTPIKIGFDFDINF